jgi:hypothetical protein
MDLLRETCTVTGKVITGYGLDEFQKNWDAHIKMLKEKGLIFDEKQKSEKKEETAKKKETKTEKKIETKKKKKR